MSLLNIFKSEKKGPEADQPKAAAVPVKAVKDLSVVEEVALTKGQAKVFTAGKGEAYKILIRPIITEKSTGLSAHQQYVFAVQPQANKIEIKKAVAAAYGVHPLQVNIIKVKGKNVRYGKTSGTTRDWKKAVVTLTAGEKIEFYHSNA